MRMTSVAESKHEPADLEKVAASSESLTAQEKELLFETLKEFEPMFGGKLGWAMENGTCVHQAAYIHCCRYFMQQRCKHEAVGSSKGESALRPKKGCSKKVRKHTCPL